ncbi:hypothetical protein SLEP1_g34595 [Rubroshorea leprosula]|uniref:Uncharacterized protein n=1 Tax=Rubroshorea leprosula TaxID=152421 RepID=A0AAV5KKH6_9ROSI|nr:hypothetical protein SLEP1_g34595 [Rubroshorea leprosula]
MYNLPRVQISVDPGRADIIAKANRGNPKSDDHIPINSGAVMRDQKLCLSIDMDLRRTYRLFAHFFFNAPNFCVFARAMVRVY